MNPEQFHRASNLTDPKNMRARTINTKINKGSTLSLKEQAQKLGWDQEAVPVIEVISEVW